MTDALWMPKYPESTNLWAFMRYIEKNHGLSLSTYQQLHAWSLQYSEQFWENLCDFFSIRFDTVPHTLLKHHENMLQATWFEGARFNFAEKLLSRQDDHPALISIDEQGNRESLSYKQLRREVAACAEGLRSRGIQSGHRIAAVMPNINTTVIAMLATASIGAIWSSCSSDFGAQAIIDRLGQINPKLLFIGDGHVYQGKTHPANDKIHQIIAGIPSLEELVICPVIGQPIDSKGEAKITRWEKFKQPTSDLSFQSLPFDHPLYILFSSGTTGKPKCIIHGAGGTLLQHVKELGLHTDLKPQDNLFFYTTCGWMMWNWMVSTLALGATLTLYEGSPTHPNANRMFELIEAENITIFGTSAKFISAIEQYGVKPAEQYSLNSLKCILSTGSPLLHKSYDFVYQHIKADLQLSSISGGTDIISCFALGNPLLPVYRGEIQCAGLGMAVAVFDEDGQSIQERRGELVCTQAFPSMPIGFWNDPDKTKYQQAYFERFPGVWAHGDFAEITEHKGIIIYGRSDATLNPGGVRIGTAEIYRQVDKISEVLEAVVIGQNWQDDTRIVLFVKLKEGFKLDERLKSNLRQTIRNNASPRHVPAKILQVDDIPRTLSGKIVELAVRHAVHGEPINNLESLANPESLEYFKNLRALSE